MPTSDQTPLRLIQIWATTNDSLYKALPRLGSLNILCNAYPIRTSTRSMTEVSALEPRQSKEQHYCQLSLLSMAMGRTAKDFGGHLIAN